MRYYGLSVACILATQCFAAAHGATLDEQALSFSYGDEETISIATGMKQPLTKAPAVATVVTAEDIRAMGALDIDDVLETVAGVHVARDVISYKPVYVFRGISSSYNPQVLMLVNGIPITNLYAGDRGNAWGGMPVEAIARIEVIRGPGSALYGADAFAGVINIVTKAGPEIHDGEAGVRAGSFDTYGGWLLRSGTGRGVEWAFMVEAHDTQGARETIEHDLQSDLDAAFGSSASLAPGPVDLQRRMLEMRADLSLDRWRLRAGWQRRDNIGTGAGVLQSLDHHGRFASSRVNADLTYDHPRVSENWDVTAQLSVFTASQEIDRSLHLLPPGTVLPVNADGDIDFVAPTRLVTFTDGLIGNPELFERHYRALVSGVYSGIKRHQIRAGAGFNLHDLHKAKERKNFGPAAISPEDTSKDDTLADVSGTPLAVISEGMRRNRYVFVQDEWALTPDWELTAGVRYDEYSDFGETVNPRAALVWAARHDLTTKLLYGRAFRAPSFAEMHNRNNPVGLGNPDLKPERIETIELAFDYRPTFDSRVAFNLFSYDWTDMAIYVPDPGATTYTAQNAGRQKGHGLELETHWKATSTLRFVGNYAYQRSTDARTDEDAGNTPHHQIYVRAQWQFAPDWQLTPQIKWVIDRDRPSGASRPAIDDYSTVDVKLRRSNVRGHWEFALIARNLLDVERSEPNLSAPALADLPLPGRALFAEARYEF